MNDEKIRLHSHLTYWCNPIACEDAEWEAAYEEFETPEEEVAKFVSRFRKLGVDNWNKDLEIADLFCGRANGLVALEQLGFHKLSGVDLSDGLLSSFGGKAELYVGDCRDLKFSDESKDVVVIQGGLHHLPDLENDLRKVLNEIDRILKPTGQLVICEPWLTPFLRIVHFACSMSLCRAVWKKLECLERMIESERDTYEAWLAWPNGIMTLFEELFEIDQKSIGLGKLLMIGSKRK